MTLTYAQKRTLYNNQAFIVDAPTEYHSHWLTEWNHDSWIDYIDENGRWLYNGAVKPFGYNAEAALQAVQYIIQTVQENEFDFMEDVLHEEDVSCIELASLHIANDEAIAIIDDYTCSTYTQRTCFVPMQAVLKFVEEHS